MTATDHPEDRMNRLVRRVRRNLTWLLEDGYQEAKALILPSRFHLWFIGPYGQVIVSVNPGMSEIEIWLRPPDMDGHGPAMQEYLAARGLPVPSVRIDATRPEYVEVAIDAQTAALEQLRHHELAGDWTPLDRESSLRSAHAEREKVISEIVDRASKPPDHGPKRQA